MQTPYKSVAVQKFGFVLQHTTTMTRQQEIKIAELEKKIAELEANIEKMQQTEAVVAALKRCKRSAKRNEWQIPKNCQTSQ